MTPQEANDPLDAVRQTVIARATGGPDGPCAQISLTGCIVDDDTRERVEQLARQGYALAFGEEPTHVKAVALPYHRDTDEPGDE